MLRPTKWGCAPQNPMGREFRHGGHGAGERVAALLQVLPVSVSGYRVVRDEAASGVRLER